MNLFTLFPPFPRENIVFVVMSFSDKFLHRWENVIQPGIQRIRIGEKPLEAIRVDQQKISDSIMTKILMRIASARLVLADISSMGKIENRTVRNENVMYEVGLAQAVRLPEEVVLLRSDEDDLSFDVKDIRVQKYDPENDPEGAQDIVAHAVLESLRGVDLLKAIAVKQALNKLDFQCWSLLLEAGIKPIKHPVIRTMRDAVGPGIARLPALSRLLEMELIRTRYEKITPEIFQAFNDGEQPERLFKYEETEFGKAVTKAYGKATGMDKLPQSLLEEIDVEPASDNRGKGS